MNSMEIKPLDKHKVTKGLLRPKEGLLRPKGGLLKGLIDTLRKPNVVQTVKLIVVIVLLLVALANRDVDFIIATLAGII